jgi:hypothetical protein
MTIHSNAHLLVFTRDELIQYFKSQTTDELKQRCRTLYFLRYVEYDINYEPMYSLLSSMILQRESDMVGKIKAAPSIYGLTRREANQL